MKRIFFGLTALLIFVFFPVIFLNKTFFFGDNFMLMIPGKLFAASALKSATIPFWNPYILSGVPFFADVSQSLLYPSTLLFFFLPTGLALGLAVLIHLLFGGIGVAMLSFDLWKKRSFAFLSAVAWSLSLGVVSSANNLADIQSKTWLPFIFLFGYRMLKGNDKKAIWFLILSLVLGFLGGHPYPLFYAVFGLGLMVFLYKHSLKEKLKAFWMVPVWCLALIVIVLLPFQELASLSTRTRMNLQEITVGSLAPQHLFSLFVPHIFRDPSRGISWGPDWGIIRGWMGYVSAYGVCALLFWATKWKKLRFEERFFLGLGGFALAYSIGMFSPVFKVFAEALPLIRLMRSPGEAGVLWVFSAALLLPSAIEMLNPVVRKHANMLLLFFGLGTAVLFALHITHHMWIDDLWHAADNALSHRISASQFHTLEKDTILVDHLLRNFGIFFALLLASTAAVASGRRWLLFAVIILDLWIAVQPTIYLAPSSIYTLNSPQAEFLSAQSDRDQWRFLSLSGYLPWTGLPTYWDNIVSRPPFADSRFTEQERRDFRELRSRRNNLAMNWGMPYALSTPRGYGTIVLHDTAEYWENAENGASINEVDTVPLRDTRLNEQGVRYILVDKLIMSVPEILKENPVLRVAKENEEYAILENPNAKPIVRAESGKIGRVDVVVNTMTFTADFPKQTSVFIAQSWYPGWSCVTSHGACVVHPARGGMQVDLPAGTYGVRLTYEPAHIKTYAAISGISLLLFILWGMKLRAPQRRLRSIRKQKRVNAI